MRQRDAIKEAFLAAAVEPDRWLVALSLLATETGSDHAQIIGLGKNYSLGFNWVSGMSRQQHAMFDRTGLVTPQTNYRVAAGITARSDAIVREDQYDAVKSRLTNHDYLDLCSDLQIPYGCQTNLRVDEQGLIGFALLRSPRTGPTTPAAVELFADMRGSAAAASALQVALEHDGHKLVAGSFDAMGTACFVLDRRMTVRAITASAEMLLRDGTVRLIDGRIGLPRLADDRRLGHVVSSVAEGRALAGNITVADPAGLIVLKVHRLPAREWSMGFAPFAIMVLKRPGGNSSPNLNILRDQYALTLTEAEIALCLRSGSTRDSICAARGITRETLRSHLRALYGKLGVRKETEAIHLLHAILD